MRNLSEKNLSYIIPHKIYHIPEYRISKIYLSYIIPHEMKCEHLKQKFWGHIMPRLYKLLKYNDIMVKIMMTKSTPVQYTIIT